MTGSLGDPVRLATAQQRLAADPNASVWVAASAGSGKTKVLTDRVLSLLLHGTAPARLLCLTFTKAAAAEMANRLAERLAFWAVAGEELVTDHLIELLGRPPSPEIVRRARRLFALVLDVPGGMKIQTIHGFCQSLLARFPLEAGIAPHVRVLDEREARELLMEARNRVLAPGAPAARAALSEELAVIATHAQEMAFSDLMQALVNHRGRFKHLLEASGGPEGLIADLYQALGVAPGEDAEGLLAAGVASAAFDGRRLALVCEALEAGSDNEHKKAAQLRRWLKASPGQRIELFEIYKAVFLTQKGARRKSLLTKGAMAAQPAALEAMEAEALRLQALQERINAARVARANAAFLRLGAEILTAFAACKQARAALDYDDIILLARDLLARRGAAAWVLYKLDGGLDHILIDEAQDTNPDQWQVVQSLCEEFFAGEGSHVAIRSIFAVGDAKQSIYSFQRADPAAFETMRGFFEGRVLAANQRWLPIDLGVSFRSTPAVLEAVDAVFAQEDARDGVVFGEAPLEHLPVRRAEPGVVELWPSADPAEAEAAEPWAIPTASSSETPARARLARLVASTIHKWTSDPASADDPESILVSKGRRVQPGDILVLVRRRNAFFEELVRDLKALDVPVAGVDRMVLSDQLAVMDLIALGQVMLLPEDDMTLACVLKGPFFGLSEEQLFDLAYGRRGSLWAALRTQSQAADAAPMLVEAFAQLSQLLAQADFMPPYEFYAEVLGRLGGRRKLLARLGPEAADAIEELLNQALLYEQERVSSLQGFLTWLESGGHEVKRDMEHGNDAVRVMTVHGAKGLQAPIVILPDTLQVPSGHGGLLWLERHGGLPLWGLKTDFDGPVAAAARGDAKKAQEQEYRRLLYVAMTRAEDRLYLCGWKTQKTPADGCWYNLVDRGLAKLPAAAKLQFDFADSLAAGWQGDGWRLASRVAVETSEKAEASADVPPKPDPLPSWASLPGPVEPQPPRPLMPSRPSGPEPALRSPLGAQEGPRFRRGRLIHKLLQHLPGIPAEARRSVARRLIGAELRHGDGLDGEEIIAETLAVLDHPEFADIFATGSQAEVPIIGLLEAGDAPQVIAGQVDRLVLGAQNLRIVDFKTNRPVPDDETEVPTVYLRQLAAYRAVLSKIYPDKTIDCLLLWTDAPRLMQISDALIAQYAP